jgi:hypothetical protein
LFALLGKFAGSFILVWLIYVAVDILVVISAISPNGEKEYLLVRVMNVVDRFGGLLTGLSYYKQSPYRAATAYATIFSTYKTIVFFNRVNKKSSQSNE